MSLSDGRNRISHTTAAPPALVLWADSLESGSCRNEEGTRVIKNGVSASDVSDAVSFQKDCGLLHYFHLCRKMLS